MADKLVRTHTNQSNRSKAKEALERKTVFRSVLDNPFRIQWSVLSVCPVTICSPTQGPASRSMFKIPFLRVSLACFRVFLNTALNARNTFAKSERRCVRRLPFHRQNVANLLSIHTNQTISPRTPTQWNVLRQQRMARTLTARTISLNHAPTSWTV